MVSKAVSSIALKSALKLLRSNPEKAIPKLIDLGDLAAGSKFPSQIRTIREVLGDPESGAYKMAVRLLNDLDGDVLEKLVENFFFNVNVKGWPVQIEAREKYGCNVPWAILLDPTSACNLHCKGCWAADYGNKLNLSFDDIDSIIEQGKELGIYMYIYTGGEPLVRKADLIKLCEKHNDCVFLSFTNGTLIDDKFCEDLLRVKNFIPAISAEGNEDTTDSRRGEGTYAKVVHAMELLKAHGLPFGISCCYTKYNVEASMSDEYFQQMVDWGAAFVWFFHYMPVGSDADIDLMCTPEQRERMYYAVRKARLDSGLFAMDFQNDGEFVQGCIAGGRRYLHINAAGDIDPCVFIHFSDSNIHEKTLLEALQSPLFMAYRDHQPFNDNMLMPCPMLENPGALTEIIEATGAHSTNLEGSETAQELCARCEKYAEHWKPVADKLWEEHPHVVDFVI